MRHKLLFAAVVLLVAIVFAQADQKVEPATSPSYPDGAHMNSPTKYREWIYLSSGLDMSYAPRVGSKAGHSMFDNVFVKPEAYRSFKETGTWPDKTVMVLEVRGAETAASINKAGHFQGEDLMGMEVHVKDAARGGWAFYGFDDSGSGKLFPKTAACYSCHEAHGAVDTTFVQFYPTLMPIARAKDTLSSVYKHENPAN